MELIAEIVGWVGAVLVLGAYALISSQKLKSTSVMYHMMNIWGAVALAAYAYWHGAIASVAVNVIWLLIGGFALVRIASL